MRLNGLVFCIVMLYFLNVFSQKEGYNWYFGDSAGITFNTTPPTKLTNGKLFTEEGSASISTPKGRLLFYTDGTSVWDSTHNKMPNGTGLKGNPSSTQSAIIVPRPDSVHIFYIFTIAVQNNSTDGIQYTEVNMKLNNGKGDVVSTRKNIQLKANVREKVTAIKKANGKDYWVLATVFGTDSFFAYSVTSSGVSTSPVISRTGFVISNSSSANSVGYLKISPDGQKVAYGNMFLDSAAIGDFDPSTGKLSNVWSFYADDSYGIEFSNKTKFLYVGEFSGIKVSQYDISKSAKATFIASRKVIDSNYANSPGALQLGPDGKIYIAIYNHTSLSVIHAPDSAGFNCRPQKNYISLGSMKSQLGLPTFIQSFFNKVAFEVTRYCTNDTAFFTIQSLTGIDSVKWNFDDLGSGINNVSKKTSAVSHIYKNTGYYNVSLIAYYKGYKDTAKLKFYVKNATKPNLGKDTVLCNSFSLTLKAQKNYLTYLWSNSSTSSSITVNQKGTYILKAKDTAGCVMSDTIVVANPKVKAKFSLSDTVRCFTKNIFKVKDSSSYTDEIRLKSNWYFGDGTGKQDTIASKTYTASGTYTIKLVVQSKLNCKDSISKQVIVDPSAVIGFNINKAQQCFKGHGFSFTNTSTLSSGTMSYNWNFGDDSTSTNKDITGKTYSKDSTFKVRLITTTDKNCKDTLVKTIIVYPNPVTKFTPSKTTQCFNNNSTNFSNQSIIRTGFIFQYKWFFGDGGTSSFFNITNKKYTYADSFSVTLLTISDKGCRDSITKTIQIYPNTKIDFRINLAVQCFNGHSFNFTDSSKLSTGTFTHDWSFGDGSTSTTKDNNGRFYFKDSTYKVTLITSTDKNCNDTLSKNVTIHPNPKAAFLIMKPFQCFRYNSSDYANMSTMSKGTISTYLWDLGDSTTSNSKNIVKKRYDKADSFHIKLITISDKGCRDSVKHSMAIHPSTDIGYTIDKDTQCFEGHKFNFTNTSTISTGFINTYDWAFSDGSTAPFRDMKNKKYNLYGNYPIRLITGSDKGCLDTLEKEVWLFASPVAGFTIDKDRQCFKNNVFNYTNTSTINIGGIISNNWQLGNGQNSGNANITGLKYTTEDTFNVRLIVGSDMSCFDTIIKKAVTYAQPVVKFTVPNDSQCWQNNFFNIINQTTLKYGTLSNTWDFGDGTYDYTYKPLSKKYANTSASYTLRYTAVSNHGCTDSARHRIILLERPIAQFTINDSVQCFNSHLFSFANNTTFSVMNTLTYYWNYGNGNNSTGINAQTATYPSPQYYNVRLVSYSSLTNCYDTIIKKVLPAPHAIPDFSVNLDSQCLRTNQFGFTNKSTLLFGQMSYEWTFNDNTFSTQKDPFKHYVSGSAYPVKLVVTTNQQCSDSIAKPVILIPHPAAKFVINDSTQCLNNHSFDFTNTTTLPYGNFTSIWLFDDATQGISKDFTTKKFTSGNWHKVTLKTNSNFNCKDSLVQTVYLEKPKNTSLTLIENDSQCMKLNKFSFVSSNTDPKVNITGWNWFFGDGNTSTNITPTYKYAIDGRFKILLQTVSANGCLDSAETTAIVLPNPVSNFSANNPCFPEPVQFLNSSTITTGKIVSYEWDFGDNTTSNVEEPLIRYKYEGKYNIKMITVSEYACRDTLYRVNGAWARSKPVAFFNYSRIPSRLPETINLQLNNLSSGNITDNFWELGNGNFSSEWSPVAEYYDTGIHRITLYVTNSDLCMDTFSIETERLFPDFYIYIPNAFSPSTSYTTNDVFLPDASPLVTFYSMEIYNRWGEKVFESSDIKKGWDGTYMGELCQEDVYLCKIYVIPLYGKKQFHETSVMLIR